MTGHDDQKIQKKIEYKFGKKFKKKNLPKFNIKMCMVTFKNRKSITYIMYNFYNNTKCKKTS